MWRPKESGTLNLREVTQACCQGILYQLAAGHRLDDVQELKSYLELRNEENEDQSKLSIMPCTIHLCQTAGTLSGSNLQVNTGYTNEKVILSVVLNRLVKDDLRYVVLEERLWHKCQRKLKKKWETYFISFQTNATDKWDLFFSKLERALGLIQKEKSKLASSFVLVILENQSLSRPQNIYTTSPTSAYSVDSSSSGVSSDSFNTEATQRNSNTDCWIIDSSTDQNTDSEETKKLKLNTSFQRPPSGVPNNSSHLSSPGQLQIPNGRKSSSSSSSAPETELLSIPPPFDPAPFVPQTTPPAHMIESPGTNSTLDTKGSVETDALSESLYIRPHELPPTLNSILLSAEKDSLNLHKDGSSLDKTEYIQAGMVTKMATKTPRQQEVEQIGTLLQTAINDGNQAHAQEYAGKLASASVTVTISVVPKPSPSDDKDQEFSLKVYIEDKEASGGSINLKVKATDTIRDLKNKMLMKHMFPVEVQTWIIGRRIPPDTETLSRCNIKTGGNTAFLYLISARSVGLTREEFQARQERTLMTPTTPGNAAHLQQMPDPEAVYGLGRVPSSKQSLPTPRQGDQIHQGLARLQYPQSAGAQMMAVPDNTYLTPIQLQGALAQQQLIQGNQQQKQKPRQPQPIPKEDLYQQPQQQQAVNIPPELPRQGRQSGLLPEQEAKDGWACTACTYINQPTRPGCEVCTHPRPSGYVIPKDYTVTEKEMERLKLEELLERQTREAEDSREARERLQSQQNYENLRVADSQELIPNTQEFQCPICFEEIDIGDGVVLRECLHSFCKDCLRDAVQYSEEAVLKCPYIDNNYQCNGALLDREVKALVTPEIYEKYLARSLTTAESQAQNSFHCKTADCAGWCIYEDHVNFFVCPVCRKENCLTCKAIHMGLNCKQYQEDLRMRARNDQEASQTQSMIEKMVQDGNAMPCPQCQVVVMKKDGCDWIQCSICKTEICWVTKGRRWGPLGNGDISGGCQCRVNGKVCHPDCNNCH